MQGGRRICEISQRRRISLRGDDLLFIRDGSSTGPCTYRSRLNGIIQCVTVQHIEKNWMEGFSVADKRRLDELYSSRNFNLTVEDRWRF